MIRKTIIVGLTLAAVGSFVFGVSSFDGITEFTWRLAEQTVLDVHCWFLGCQFSYLAGVAEPSSLEPTGFYHEFGTGVSWHALERGLLHFAYGNESRGGENHGYVHFPFWVPVVLFAAYPMFTFIRGPLRRYRRRKRGLCETCGYDLRGSPGRCSECGSVA